MRRLVWMVLIVSGVLYAQQGMLPSTFEQLERVQDLMAAERYEEASDRLSKTAESLSRRPYDLAFVHHTHAYVFLAEDRYDRAAEQFEKALALEQLPIDTAAATLIALAQIHLLQNRPKESIAVLTRWQQLAQPDPAPIGFVLLSSAHLELEAYAKAYGPLKKAITLSSDPPASWRVTLASLSLELGFLDGAIGIYRDLLDQYGPAQGSYWMGLATAYLMKEDEPRALDALQAALMAGVLQGDGVRLWRLQMLSGVPMRAARLITAALERGEIKASHEHYELLFHAYRLAKEGDRAIEALLVGAALPGGERLWEPLASAAMAQYRYDLAIQAADRALADGGKNPGTLWMIKASAHYEQGEKHEAIRAFEQAARYDLVQKSARRWLSYLRTL